jgi:phytoene dehydrogenase-like protein
LTTLHLLREPDASAILGIPGDVAQVALVPVAHTVATSFRPAQRRSYRTCCTWRDGERARPSGGLEMKDEVTVIGGGVGGLVAAIAAREAGLAARVVEAKPELGGRGTSLVGPYKANWGPHVLYANGTFWQWLQERGLGEPAAGPAMAPVRFRWQGEAHRIPPRRAVMAARRIRRRDAPADLSFRDWIRPLVDESVCSALCRWPGALCFHHDPGQLAASFTIEKLHQVTRFPPTPRYVRGGWRALIQRLAAHATRLGASIETGARVGPLLDGPVIVATRLETAATLTGDDTLAWPGSQIAAVDVAVERRRGDTYVLFDLDEGGLAVAYTYPDPSLAPPGEHLIQAQIGVRPGERSEAATERVERLLDAGFHGWRKRVTWHRKLRLVDQTGAIDPPGSSWRDRPAVDRGDGLYVVSDKSRAPGLLSEVTINAALLAVRHFVGAPATGGVSRP